MSLKIIVITTTILILCCCVIIMYYQFINSSLDISISSGLNIKKFSEEPYPHIAAEGTITIQGIININKLELYFL